MTAGGLLALLSALAFGAIAPLVQRFGREGGPFVTAALLYGGAALFSGAALLAGARGERSSRDRARLRSSDLPRLVVVAMLGAVVAPVALAWGLQRTDGVTASLLLNLEAVFTVLLARALWAEPIGARVGSALLAMTAGGGMLLASSATTGGAAEGAAATAHAAGHGAMGVLALLAATLAWAADNTVGKPLADREASAVVFAKGAIGAGASAAIALLLHEPAPALADAAALVACGAIGVGASLVLYLRAQRRIGAARTGSIFAAAPFVGAAIAWALGQRAAGASTAVAGALFLVGLWLHLTERHEHSHSHEAIAHSHAHSHDDPHHHHSHAGLVVPLGAHGGEASEREHTHEHRHEGTTHSHPHGLDEHHRHRH